MIYTDQTVRYGNGKHLLNSKKNQEYTLMRSASAKKPHNLNIEQPVYKLQKLQKSSGTKNQALNSNFRMNVAFGCVYYNCTRKKN